jgi:hypothetical protein
MKNTATARRNDKNVVSGRGDVAKLPDQGTNWGPGLKWFTQKLEQFVLVVSAESQLCSVFQKY